MAPINEKTLVDQETGYSSLSEATPLKEHKSSWRRVGVAAAVLSALALVAVAATNTSSPKRANKTTELEDYPLVSISNTVDHKVSGMVAYAGPYLLCKTDYCGSSVRQSICNPVQVIGHRLLAVRCHWARPIRRPQPTIV